MENENRQRFEGKYDSDSFSEDYVDDISDGELPKLQFFRAKASKARWIEELGMAELLEIKGKMWITTGIVRGGKIYYTIEETLFLAEIGALGVLSADDTPLSLSDLYGKLAEDNNKYGCSWESFVVYRRLKYLGYIVGRHCVPWSLKNINIKPDDEEKTEESDRKIDKGLDDISSITKMFKKLQFNETKPIFDVYSPDSKFKKTSPGSPLFVLFLTGNKPLSEQDIKEIEANYDGSPLKFCNVDDGRVIFLEFTKVKLRDLP